MEIDLALLADAATVDGSGKLNILGVFDRISVQRFPAKHGRIALVIRLSAGLEDAGAHEMSLRMRSPSGAEVVGLQGSMQLGPGPGAAGGRIRIPHILNLDGIVFEESGLYSFDLQIDGQHHVSLPLAVVAAGMAKA